MGSRVNKEEMDSKILSAKHWDEVLSKEFSKESDRACVILVGSLLDQALEILLKTYLVTTDSADDNLFDDAYSPISTFSAKIDLSYRLGLISKRFCRDLHLIRKIRNDFAHNIIGCTFDEENVRHRIIELRRSSIYAENLPDVRNTFSKTSKGDFQMVVSWMLWYLCTATEYVNALSTAPKEWGYYRPQEWAQLQQSVKPSEK